MNKERLLKILLAPHISEKGASTKEQYVFKVTRSAIKPEIKCAIEGQFGVIVRSVRICNLKVKTTRCRQTRGRRKNWKKAYVTLMPGSEIINIATHE
ncbi:50S ribosomal protein L23 [Coxiella endosymbiont of Amblyomma nuttalli]|uniref:50S ribosomal protein L23 n=1 Tax=Coxiella endosymbiont of Amblyomma nuttalli TaxID=2749996 RepID=UPI001BA836E0|nr:50S ribosomal protein L23 [Coxiella endosymbiont of Amblyomma nuttalli]QTS83793.1 50S ribosomal protein L23 [Coxiella endosymbiont of Amblyomma nuttalli]